MKAINERAAPAGTGSGSKIQKPLSPILRSYCRNARSASPLRDLAPAVLRTIDEHGTAALEMPKRAATLHEAGHVVLYAVEGQRVKSVRIKSRRIGGKLAWGGQTFVAEEPWRVDATTDPADDLRQARFVLAGVCAERLFDPDDFREGSSLDERLLAQKICRAAAMKLDRGAQALLSEAMLDVRRSLIDHADVVFRIASDLDRHGWVRGQALQDMLRPIRERSR